VVPAVSFVISRKQRNLAQDVVNQDSDAE